MPKQNFEISTFTNGIISNPSDELDIPVDAATYSLNIDPQTEGSLGGIPDDTFLKESGFTTDMSEMTYSQGTTTTTGGGTTGTAGKYGQQEEQ